MEKTQGLDFYKITPKDLRCPRECLSEVSVSLREFDAKER